MKKIFLAIAGAAVLASGCAVLSPKRPMDAYFRPGAPARPAKVIVFPLLAPDGQRPEGAQDLEPLLAGKWGELYGAKNLIPAGPVMAALAGNSAFPELLKTMDNTAALEQLKRDPRLRQLLAAVAAGLGPYSLALAVADGGRARFAGGAPVHLNLGYFDTRNLVWRWITRTAATKGKISKWEVDSAGMVSDSFKKITALTAAAAAKYGYADEEAVPDYGRLAAAAAASAAGNDYPAAISYYQQALEIKKSDPQLHIGLADAFMKMNSPMDAEEEYSAAYELLPDNDARGVYLSERLGTTLLLQKSYKDAKAFFEQAIELANGSRTARRDLFTAYHGLAVCLERTNNPGPAIYNYDMAARLAADPVRKMNIRKHIEQLKRKR